MTTDTRIISHKLSLLKLEQSINNISKACRDSFVSRTTFYDTSAGLKPTAYPVLKINQDLLQKYQMKQEKK